MPFHVMDVEEAYAKDSNLKREDVKILIDWMEKQPHLPKTTELQIALFLHSCYYRLEAAKTTIDNFFTVRTLCPDIFYTPNVESLKIQLSVGSINFLPKRTPNGSAICFFKLLDTNSDHYNHLEQLNFADSLFMLDLHQRGFYNGIISIFDMTGFTFGHMMRLNLGAMKKHMYYIQEAAPVRIKEIHFINVVPFLDKLIGLIKPFLKKELYEMLTFHTESIDSLFKYIPKEIMPQDYGGEAPSTASQREQNERNLLENMDFFKWLNGLKVDENKRPGKPKNAGQIFGMDGSFKKLEVD